MKDLTRGIAVSICETLCYEKIDSKRSRTGKDATSKEMLSLDTDLKNRENFNLIVIYWSPNDVFKSSINPLYGHQVVVRNFNRRYRLKLLHFKIPDDCTFVKATRDSYLTRHSKDPSRGRGTNKPSILILVFISREEAIEDINVHSLLVNLITL